MQQSTKYDCIATSGAITDLAHANTSINDSSQYRWNRNLDAKQENRLLPKFTPIRSISDDYFKDKININININISIHCNLHENHKRPVK